MVSAVTTWQQLLVQENGATATAMTSLDSRGLAYGDGFFTTMGVIDGVILWSDYHQQRLVAHADALQLTIPSQALLALLQTQAKQLQQGMLKVIITRATQDVRGYGYIPSPSGSASEIWLKSTMMPIATDEQMLLPDGRSVPMQPAASAICLAAQLACLPPTLAGLKTLNRLDSVLAAGELQGLKKPSLKTGMALDWGEGLLRDMSGHWIEGTMSNVFYQLSESIFAKPTTRDTYQNNPPHLSNGQWFTPSVAQSGVAGVMRQVIIDALSTTKQPIIIRALQDKDLPNLTQLFFCNALRGIMPMANLTLLSGKMMRF